MRKTLGGLAERIRDEGWRANITKGEEALLRRAFQYVVDIETEDGELVEIIDGDTISELHEQLSQLLADQ